MMSSFGELVDKYIQDNNLTLDAFASSVGYSSGAVWHWINADRAPQKRHRLVVAEKLGYNLKDFNALLASDAKRRNKEGHNLFVETMLVYACSNNITYTDLADKIGVSRYTLDRWLSGTRFPRPCNMHAIAMTLEISNIECAYLVIQCRCKHIRTKMGFILRVLRYSLGMNMTEISEVTGIKQAIWMDCESLQRVINRETIQKLANWLGVSASYVYKCFTEDKPDILDLSDLETLYEIVSNKVKEVYSDE